MSMKMGYEDFKFVKDKLRDDRTFHEREFMQRIDPYIIDAYYEGMPDNPSRGINNKENAYINFNEISASGLRMTQNRIFPTTATLMTQLYPNNTKFLCTPRTSEPVDKLNAKVSEGSINYYWKQMNAEEENKLAIMSAWLYGYGAVKQGWRTQYKKDYKAQEQQLSLLGRLTSMFKGNPGVEETITPDYIDYECPFLNYVNPINLYLDSSKPFKKGRYIHERITKSLSEIKDTGLYEMSDDFYNRYKGDADPRMKQIDLFESWIWWNDELYLCVTCDHVEYQKPLRFQKMPYMAEGFPYQLLAFNKQVNRTYPISHMKVAQRQQRLLDYILNLQRETIEKYKDFTVFSGDAFDRINQERIKANVIGTNVFTKDGFPVSNAVTQVTSGNIPTNLFALQNILDMNIKEILTVLGARQSGESDFDTATQEQIAEQGNIIRSLGLQEEVNEFLKVQGKKLLQDLRQFATTAVKFQVAGINIKDPMTGELITDRYMEFGTMQSPRSLRDVITSEVDIDIDVTESVRRDLPIVRKQLGEIIALAGNPSIQQALAMEGKKIKIAELFQDLLNNFDTISNAEKYFEDIQPPIPGMMGGMQPPEMQGMPMAEGLPPMSQGPVPMQGAITPEGLEQGINVMPPQI